MARRSEQGSPVKRTTIDDVAAAAGVSIMSVSRAMRDVEGISAKKREEILKVARSMNYSPSRVAVSLAASSSNMIGFSVPTLFGTVFSEMYDGMRAAFEKAGFATMIDITDYNQAHEEAWVERMIAWRPAGLILSGVDHSEQTRSGLLRSKIPVLEIWDYTKTPIDLCVGIDHFASGADMGAYLADLGYRRPAYVGVTSGKDVRADRRFAGLQESFGMCGFDFIAIDRQSTTANFETGHLAAKRILNIDGLRPDVICFLNDNMAFGGLTACQSVGLNCPGDIGIVGYNGLNINAVLAQRITTSLTPRRQIGEVGARKLIAKILGARTDNATKLKVTIEPGQTTRKQKD